MSTIRAFIAFDLAPLPALEGFLRELSGTRGLKPVEPDSLHVTLKFLGDIQENLIPQIEGVMRDSCRDVPTFQVEVLGSGMFPPKGEARVAWAGLKGAEPMAGIASNLEKGLEPLGFTPEKRTFRAHLTLARVKDPSASAYARKVVEAHSTDLFGTKRVSELLLKKSVLRPQGPEYSTLVAIGLRG